MADADAFKDFEDTENFLSRYAPFHLVSGLADLETTGNYWAITIMTL